MRYYFLFENFCLSSSLKNKNKWRSFEVEMQHVANYDVAITVNMCGLLTVTIKPILLVKWTLSKWENSKTYRYRCNHLIFHCKAETSIFIWHFSLSDRISRSVSRNWMWCFEWIYIMGGSGGLSPIYRGTYLHYVSGILVIGRQKPENIGQIFLCGQVQR